MNTPERQREAHTSGAAGATPGYSASGMVRIGRSPARTALPLVLPVTVVGALGVAGQTTDLFNNWAWAFPVAFAGCAVLLGGGTLIGLALYYRPVAYDPAAGLARLGRATVPLASVTTARREVRAGWASTVLSYRFATTDGAWGRVLVTGRPMRGLRSPELRLLEQFVAATAIPDRPAPGELAPSQRLVAEAIGMNNVTQAQPYSAKRPVGKAEILAELRREAPAAKEKEVDPPLPATLDWQWYQDDQDAESVVLTSAANTVRRAFGWATAGGVGAGMAVVMVAAILEASGGLDTATNDAIAALVGLATVIGLVGYLGYAIAGFVSAQRAQRAVLTWLRDRDDQQVARGLPPRLLAPFLGNPPAHRLRLAGGIASIAVGGVALCAGVVAVFVTAPAAVTAGLLLPGLVLLWVGIALVRRAGHAARAHHELAARLGGRRLAERLADATEI